MTASIVLPKFQQTTTTMTMASTMPEKRENKLIEGAGEYSYYMSNYKLLLTVGMPSTMQHLLQATSSSSPARSRSQHRHLHCALSLRIRHRAITSDSILLSSPTSRPTDERPRSLGTPALLTF